jgi:hypothetical protein
MEQGLSQRQAAKSEGITVHSLARHRQRNTRSKFKNGRWTIFDLRPDALFIASKSKIIEVAVRQRSASIIGKYWNAVNAALDSNDPARLQEFDGVKVRDVYGHYHLLETDLNALRRLDAIGDLGFTQIYANKS